jgi:glycerol-3-phosphate dehydrogenase (NAD(P)+)
LPDHPYAVLSGPNFAHEVARGLPAAATFATHAPKKDARIWAEHLRGNTFRPYLSDDPVGAEVAGALKNVIAIACGIVEGKKLGQNARAAVMTRGMAEIRRLGVHKGGKIETFLGLSGIGDLNLTCNSMSSRNFSLGAELGHGRSLADILSSRHSVAEGVATARAATAYAQAHGIDMPVTQSVDAILHDGQSVDAVVTGLLSRALRDESE